MADSMLTEIMPISTEAGSKMGVESPKIFESKTDNFLRLVKRLEDIEAAMTIPKEPVSLEDFEKAAQVFQRDWTDFVGNDGNLNVAAIEEFSAQISRQKYDQVNTYVRKQQEVVPEQLAVDINDLSTLVKMEKFIDHFSDDQMDKAERSDLMRHFRDGIEKSELLCLQQMSILAVDYYSKDVLVRTQIPGANDERGSDERSMFYALRRLALASPEPTIEEDYRTLLRNISGRAHGYIYDSDRIGESDRIGAALAFNKNFNKVEWDELKVSLQQTRHIYELIEDPLMSVLFRGGVESWDGTSAASCFGSLKDPRAIPKLVEHLRIYGAGHTTAVVSYVIDEALKHPVSKEDLDNVINSMSEINKDVVLKWYMNPDSLFQKLSGYGKAEAVKNAQQLFLNEALCMVAQQVAKDKGIQIDEGSMVRFFTGSDYSTEIIEDLLLENIKQVADIISKGMLANLRETQPKLFHNLVNPKDGDFFYFPKAIAQNGLKVSQEALSRLESLYQSRELQTGIMDRNNFAEGLLFLSGRKDGRQMLEDLLSKTTGARADSRRLREIFSLMKNMENFGGFEFPNKDNLQEIIADLREQLVVKAADAMGLGQEDLFYLREGLEKFSQSGLFEIIPTLLRTYGGRTDVKRVITEIGQHIVRDDFQSWRNSTETSLSQLSVLGEDAQVKWVSPSEDVRINIDVQSDKERRVAAVETVKKIAGEAKAHILDVYKMEFSQDRLRVLAEVQKGLLRDLKSESFSQEEKRELGIRKRTVDAEVRILEGLLGIEELDPVNFDIKKIPEMISRIKSAMQTLKGLEQPISDLDQVELVLTAEKDLVTVSTIRAYDSDDPMILLNIGMEPRETCQSWRQGSFNYCLPAYVADANKRVINVENERGEVLARSVIKLTNIMTEEGQKPAILMEPIYSNSELGQIYQAIVRSAVLKAKSVGAVLVMTKDVEVATGADNTRMIPVMETEAKKQGMNFEESQVELFLPQSYNSYEYSDSLGGMQQWFERYETIPAVVAK